MQDPQKIWTTAMGEVEFHVSSANFNTWLKPCKLLTSEEGVWTVGVPNGFSKARIESKYQPLIEKILSQHTGRPTKILCELYSPQGRTPSQGMFAADNKPGGGSMDGISRPQGYRPPTPPVVNEAISPPTPSFATPKPQPTTGGIEGLRLNPRFRFENFVVGENNKLAHAASIAVAEHPGQAYNPLFLYGGVGLGKTHLMHAMAQSIRDRFPDYRILYVTSEKFTNELISAIRNNQTEQFRQKYRPVQMLLIDDIQFIAGKETTQEEFFHTFNAIYEAGHQIVLTSDRPPNAIPTLEARLQSRFGAGLIADVQRPNYETRVAILDAKAKDRGLNIPPEVTTYIADQVSSNIRDLEGALNRVMTHCRVYDLPITRDVAANILAAYQTQPKQSRVTPDTIIQTVAAYYSIEPAQMKGKSRKQVFVVPRQIAMYFMREKAEASLNQIGEEFGGRDHTTVLHACQKIERELEDRESTLKRDIEILEQKLYT